MEAPAREALAGMLDRITGLLDVPRSDGEWNPYDLAFAVERYLSNALAVGSDGQIVRDDEGNPRPLYPLTTDIELPPPGEDVVHWFLFKNLDRDGLPIGGYYDYHASAMAVLLQLADVPARIATGFALSGNNFDERTGNYLVRGQDSYTWVQVYFPGYGWVDFDPTPGTTVDETLAGIAGTGPRIAAQRLETPRIDLSPTSQSELDEFQLDELLALLAEQLEPGATAGEAGRAQPLVLARPGHRRCIADRDHPADRNRMADFPARPRSGGAGLDRQQPLGQVGRHPGGGVDHAAGARGQDRSGPEPPRFGDGGGPFPLRSQLRPQSAQRRSAAAGQAELETAAPPPAEKTLSPPRLPPARRRAGQRRLIVAPRLHQRAFPSIAEHIDLSLSVHARYLCL